jgi:hypothetical protein
VKARRTHESNVVLQLQDGNEDNDVWATRTTDSEGRSVIVTVWEPDEVERAALANGENIAVIVWLGEDKDKTAPMNVSTIDVPLGKAPSEEAS